MEDTDSDKADSFAVPSFEPILFLIALSTSAPAPSEHSV